MTRRRRSLLPGPALAVALLLGGCTIMDMRAENDLRAKKVSAKETQLADAHTVQSQLQTERATLLADLKTRELSVGELKARLQKLQQINTRSSGDTPAREQQKAARARLLDDAAAQVRSLEQQDSTSAAGQDAKVRQLEKVRQDLRRTLEQLAMS